MVRLALPAHDCGVVLRSRGNRLPGVLLYAPESKNVKPAINLQNMQTVQVSFNVTVPAQSTAAVVWGLARRTLPAALDGGEMKNQLKVFQDREWLADLPESLVKAIVNYRRSSSGNVPHGPLLQPVLDLASQYDLERGKADVLVQDEQSQVPGRAAGSDLSIETSLGKAVVPLGDVALFCGGAHMERPMRLYLRKGEILVGRVEAKNLVLKTQTGVEAKLLPEEINMLFLHAADNDGNAAADAQAIVETHDGQRLLLADSNAQFHAVTPWGGLDFGLGDIDRLSSRHEPQPMYRLTFRDGSDLSILLQGEPPPLKSLRFGPVKLAAGVRHLWSLKTPLAAKEPDQEEPAAPAGPHCRLIGKNVLAGTIDSPKLNLETVGGVLAISASQIQSAQRSGDPQAGGPVDMELADGRHLTGLLTDRTIAIRFHGKVWEVPSQYLIGISSGKTAAAATPGPGAAAPDKAAAKEEGGSTPAVAKPDRPEPDVPRPALVPVLPAPPAAPVPAAPAPPAVAPPPADQESPFGDIEPGNEDDPFMPPEQLMAEPEAVPPAMPPPSDTDPFGTYSIPMLSR